MPSPVGHSLIGLAVGAAFWVPRSSWHSLARHTKPVAGILLLGVLLANAPDVDYVPGSSDS